MNNLKVKDTRVHQMTFTGLQKQNYKGCSARDSGNYLVALIMTNSIQLYPSRFFDLESIMLY